jgi:hypothetical protein
MTLPKAALTSKLKQKRKILLALACVIVIALYVAKTANTEKQNRELILGILDHMPQRVELALRSGADPNAWNWLGLNPSMHYRLELMFTRHPKSPPPDNAGGESPGVPEPVLLEAVDKEELEIVRSLLRAGADPRLTDAYGCSAISEGHRGLNYCLHGLAATKPSDGQANRDMYAAGISTMSQIVNILDAAGKK